MTLEPLRFCCEDEEAVASVLMRFSARVCVITMIIRVPIAPDPDSNRFLHSQNGKKHLHLAGSKCQFGPVNHLFIRAALCHASCNHPK